MKEGILRRQRLGVFSTSVVYGLCLIPLPVGSHAQKLSDTGEEASLSHPDGFTNVVYVSRSIGMEDSMLHFTRYWLAGGYVHILSQSITNIRSVNSLDAVPEVAWANGSMAFELIKNAQGVFVRMRRPANWAERIEGAKQLVASGFEGRQAEFRPLEPESWQEAHEPDSWLKRYSLTVDADDYAKHNLSSPGAVIERGRLAIVVDGNPQKLSWELLFDPVTGMKRTERRWLNGNLVFEAQWNTTQSISSAQFQIQDKDLEAWRGRFGPKAGGVGLLLAAGELTGPFTVVGIVSNSAAAGAGIEPGSLILAIDGRDTTGMSQNEAVDLIRGLPGTRVKIELSTPPAQQRKPLELERQILWRPPAAGRPPTD
jgi:hypothetical protein